MLRSRYFQDPGLWRMVMKFAGRLLDLLNVRSLLSANVITRLRSFPLLAGLLLVPALLVGQTFVQVNNNTDLVNAASLSVTYTAAETAGNMNIVVVGVNDSSSSVLSVTDDNNNTYVLAAANAGHGLSQAVYYARNISVALHNPPTVTVTFNQNAGLPDVRILEYSGLGTTATVDNWAGNSGDSIAPDSGSATTTNAGDLILGAGITRSHFSQAGTNFTLRVITFPFGDIIQDMNGGQPAAAYNATAPLAYSNPWIMQMVGFSSTGLTFTNPPASNTTTPMTPTSGPDIGGTAVTIFGSGFQPGAVVLFGSGATAVPGVNCVVLADTTITCKTPASTADVAVDITVINVDGQSSTAAAAYTFLNVTPTITTVAPATGPTNGGTTVSITGSNFQAGAEVTIGGLAAGDVVVHDTSTITANSPALPVGAAQDVVVNDLGAAATAAGAFTYALGTGPINYIQGGSTGTGATQATLIEVMPAAQTAGHLNVVVVGWSDTTSTITSVTDTEGNTYAVGASTATGTGIRQAIYYAKNIVGDTGSPNQITVTFNQPAVAPDLRIFEYSGLDTTSPLDVAASSSGNGTLGDTGACTTLAAVDLIVGAGTTNTHFTGPGSGFNLLDISNPNGGSSEHQITSAAGSCEATSPLITGNWVMQAAAFKVAGAVVPGFTISATPASQTVAAGTSATYTVTVTPTNGFTGAVVLSCGSVSLPAGAICGFTPASVTPSGAAVTASLSISTTAATPVSTSVVTITGTFGSLVHSTTASLTVTAAPASDFAVVATALSPASIAAGGTSTSTVTVAALGGFNSTVNLTCAIAPVVTPAPTCTFNPAAVTNGAGASTVTVHTSGTTPASAFTVTITGTSGVLVHTTPLSLTVTAAVVPDFTITGTALTPATIAAGASSTSTITIAAVAGFTSTVNLTCAITPAAASHPATCAFSPAAVTGGAGPSTLTVSTTAATTASVSPQSRGIFFAMLLPIGGLALLGTGISSRKKKFLGFFLGCVLFSGLIFLSACGGSSSGGGGGTGHAGTSAGTYTVTVTGTGPAGALAHTTTLTLTVQ
jgi:IPT/TIG domain